MARPLCGHAEFKANCPACKLWRDDPTYRELVARLHGGPPQPKPRPGGVVVPAQVRGNLKPRCGRCQKRGLPG